MSSIRKCIKCGQRISLRKMPHGKWVAFDASTQIAHKCNKKNNPDANIKDLVKNKIIKETEEESISIKYEDEISSVKISENIEKIIEQPKKIKEEIKEEIKEKININEEDIKVTSAEELIKDYKSDNAVTEQKFTTTNKNSNGDGFFKFVLYAALFFLAMFLLSKAPAAVAGIIGLAFFIFFVAKK